MVSLNSSAMKSSQAPTAPANASSPTAEQLVLNAYLASTSDPAFRAFAKKTLVPKRRKKAAPATAAV